MTAKSSSQEKLEVASGDFLDPWTDRAHRALYRYLQSVSDWHGYMKFLGLEAFRSDGQDRDVPLRNLFVEPTLSYEQVPPDRLLNSTQAGYGVDLNEAVQKYRRLVILGDPGSGKSTIINWICDAFTHPSSSALRERLGPLVPFPFILRELQVNANTNWEGLLDAFLTRPVAAHIRGNKDLMMRLLESGQAVVLLDGVDEIGAVSLRRSLRNAVAEGFRRFPLARFVITSRIVGYNEVPFHGRSEASTGDLDPNSIRLDATRTVNPSRSGRTDPILAYVTPFSDAQISTFASLWWRQHSNNPHLQQTNPQEFVHRLRQNRSTLALARNPNVLTLILLIYRKMLDLPDGRAKLYRLIAAAYLENIDAAYEKNARVKIRPLTYSWETMANWLGVVAWQLQRRRGESAVRGYEALLTEPELHSILVEAIEPAGDEKPTDVARSFIQYAARRSGLLVPRGQDDQGRELFAFQHLSFQEYFASQYLRDVMSDAAWAEMHAWNAKRETSLEDFRRYAASRSWRETLVFLWESAAITAQVFAQRLTERLLGWHPGMTPKVLDLTFARRFGANDDERVTSETVVAELLAMIAVNPHIQLGVTFRSRLRELVWNWEWKFQRARQDAGIFSRDENVVGRVLLSRSWCVAQVREVIVERLAEEQALPLLSLAESPALEDLNGFEKLSKLEALNLCGCSNLSDICALEGFDRLRRLSLDDCPYIRDLSPLSACDGLKMLSLSNCTGVEELAPLGKMKSLERLYLDGCSSVRSLRPLKRIKSLRALFTDEQTSGATLSALGEIRQLEELMFCGGGNEEDVEALSGMRSLRALMAFGWRNVRDISALRNLEELKSLTLQGCARLIDLSPLSQLKCLTNLRLMSCPGVVDLSPLSSTKLEKLELSSCNAVSDLDVLVPVLHLRELGLKRCAGVSRSVVRRFSAHRPDVHVEYEAPEMGSRQVSLPFRDA